MNCPRCGSTMVEKPASFIYTSNPPQWDSVIWCACGYQESRGRVYGKSLDESMLDQWHKANPGRK